MTRKKLDDGVRRDPITGYEDPQAGEWVQPIRRGYLMQCCDCGLVHRMNFRVYRGRAQMQVFRAERETKRIRRKRGITITHPRTQRKQARRKR